MTQMKPIAPTDDATYRRSMGRLLVLYTQVDRLIMEVCAERIGTAPDEPAKLALAKQVGDESRHVAIQRDWMAEFGTASEPLLTADQEDEIRAHFSGLSWHDFLADLYLCIEALGSEAVERIVPLADPGTRQSLAVPLEDELDHVAFGVSRLRQELAALSEAERAAFMARLPDRIDALTDRFFEMQPDIGTLFSGVGADFDALCEDVSHRREEILSQVGA